MMRTLLFSLLCFLALAGCNQANIKTNDSRAATLINNRADPWVLRTDTGYYFTASVPEYDRLELRYSETLAGLGSAVPKVIWSKHNSGPQSANIWAPEIHKIDDAWYIYYAAGEAENPFNIRMYAIRNTSADPMQGQWQELGRLDYKTDSFSLDMTTFEHRGKRYMIWAQQNKAMTYNSALVLAEMETPTKMSHNEVVISQPQFPWEKEGFYVNEGPSVLKRHGKILVTYSASATDDRYKIGLLWAEEDADLLNPNSWHKSPRPLFYSNADLQRFGPGHSSFTLSDDGKRDILVYHAREYKDINGDPLYDPNRNTRIREFGWSIDDFPDFFQESPDK